MATAQSFEDLVVWQRARELVQMIYFLTKQGNFICDRGLVDQICRAAVSVMSNIAEGFERGGKDETIQFLYIAKASCGEVRAQLYVALDQHYMSQEKFNEACALCKETSRLLFNFIESIKVSRYQGLKFKRKNPDHEALVELYKEFPQFKPPTFKP